MFAFAALSFALLMRINAPYGRHGREGWGPTIRSRTAWVVFESPAVIVFALVFLTGDHALETVPLVFLAAWQFHYLQRSFLFPFRLRDTGKRTPWLIVVLAVSFNTLNAYVNARWVSHFGSYDESWLTSLPFVTGMTLFVAGWIINQRADGILLSLRKPGETHYSIPEGGLFRFVSCPNYFGEILEWMGWAVMTWSLAGAAFAVFTLANLLPRALANHRWYQQQFEDYPASRRAVIPFLL